MNKQGQDQKLNTQFNTASNCGLTKATPTLLREVLFNPLTRSISCYCSDASVKVCRIDRMESLASARALWSDLQGLKDLPVQFYVAGGNNPDKWFCKVEESSDAYLRGQVLFSAWSGVDHTLEQDNVCFNKLIEFTEELYSEGRHPEGLENLQLAKPVLKEIKAKTAKWREAAGL